MNLARLYLAPIGLFLFALAACATSRTDTHATLPPAQAALLDQSSNPNSVGIEVVDGVGKSWGIGTTVSLPAGRHMLGFRLNPLKAVMAPSDFSERPGRGIAGAVRHYGEFDGEPGHLYKVTYNEYADISSPGKFSFVVDIVDAKTGESHYNPIGNYYNPPILSQ